MSRSDEARRVSAYSPTEDDLDYVLGLTAALLRQDGKDRASSLLAGANLEFAPDGYCYRPREHLGDNWAENTYEAILHVPAGSSGFDSAVTSAVWAAMGPLLERLGCPEVQSLVVRERPAPLPEVDPDWRAAIARERPSNQGHRARDRAARGEDAVTYRGLFFDSAAEVEVFKMLERLQRELGERDTIAIAPLSGVAMRDTHGPTLTPDLLVLGRGRVVVVETDGDQHRAPSAAADDQNRDRHWMRCGLPRAVRITTEDLKRRPREVERVLREDLARALDIPDLSEEVVTRSDDHTTATKDGRR